MKEKKNSKKKTKQGRHRIKNLHWKVFFLFIFFPYWITLIDKLYLYSSLVAQWLKHLPPMRETQLRSLGREDPLEKEMVIHSSILAWRIPWTEKPGRLQSTGSQRVGHDWATSLTHQQEDFLSILLFYHQLMWEWQGLT